MFKSQWHRAGPRGTGAALAQQTGRPTAGAGCSKDSDCPNVGADGDCTQSCDLVCGPNGCFMMCAQDDPLCGLGKITSRPGSGPQPAVRPTRRRGRRGRRQAARRPVVARRGNPLAAARGAAGPYCEACEDCGGWCRYHNGKWECVATSKQLKCLKDEFSMGPSSPTPSRPPSGGRRPTRFAAGSAAPYPFCSQKTQSQEGCVSCCWDNYPFGGGSGDLRTKCISSCLAVFKAAGGVQPGRRPGVLSAGRRRRRGRGRRGSVLGGLFSGRVRR